MTKKTDQKTTQTLKNTVESPKSAQFFSAESSRLTDFSTPIYNMGVTTLDPRLQYDEFTFPRRLDNCKMVLTDKGNVPVLHSVPCDEYGIASHDWITFGFCQSTLGQEYYSLDPMTADSELTYGIETFLDHQSGNWPSATASSALFGRFAVCKYPPQRAGFARLAVYSAST